MAMPLWLAIPSTFVFAAFVGSINGVIVIRSGLPSFIVTLAFCSSCATLAGGAEIRHRRRDPAARVREAVEGDWLAPILLGRRLPAASSPGSPSAA